MKISMKPTAHGRAVVARFTVAGSLAAIVLSTVPSAIPVAAADCCGGEILAIENVTVLPMDRERELPDQTVIVRDGRIAEIGPAATTEAPEGAVRVDGRGKVLLPGLVDMHVHVAPGTGDIADPAGRTLSLLVANGITTARSMIGNPDHLALRGRVERGEVTGPSLVLAGAPLTGTSAPTADSAAALVRAQARAGYDFVKVIGGFGPDVYDAVVAAARESGLPVAGHVTPEVGLERAIAAGQQVEHLDGWVDALVADDSPVAQSESQVAPGPILEHLDEGKLPALAARMRDRKIWNAPTLTLFELLLSERTADELASRPEMRYVPPKSLAAWREQRSAMLADASPASERGRFVEIRRRTVRALDEAGAKLLAGSDSPQFFQVAGYALHDELASLADAGLSPYAVLETATRNPAEYLGRLSESGTVEIGKRADLLLVEGDPLGDLSRLRRPVGVVLGGRWLPRAELDGLLDRVAASAAAQE
jgi:imidazolonepropionase-like amidohydrolase